MDAPQIAGDKSGGRMITLTREEAQQVLDSLEAEHRWLESLNTGKTMRAIETLRARLAQPEPEPVAWMMLENKLVPIHTAPPQREWQGLTDEERLRCFDDVDWNKVDWCPDHEQYAKAIEAKLKEKNT
jgi:hypothetical protein